MFSHDFAVDVDDDDDDDDGDVDDDFGVIKLGLFFVFHNPAQI